MKKLLLFLVVICTLVAFTACDVAGTVEKYLGRGDDSSENDGDQGGNNGNTDDSDNSGNTDDKENTPDDSGNTDGGNADNDSNGDNTEGGSGDTVTESKEDQWREEYDCITVAEAFDICDAAGSTKSDRYYLIGTVVSVEDTYYGKMIIKDSTGELLVYGSYGADGEDRYGDLTVAVPKAGDVVLFYGNFMNFNGTREMYSGWMIDFYTPGANDSDNGGSGESTKADEWREEYDVITIGQAFGICDAAGSTKSDRYYLIGTVVSVEDTYYGKMIIKDSTGELLVYGSYGADGEDRYGDLTVAVPKAGDVVLFYGNFMNFNGTREMYSGWMIDFYTPGVSDSGSSGGNSGSGSAGTTHTNTAFSAEDKNLLLNNVGIVIPFIPCDEYELEEYYDEADGLVWFGVYFCALGNTKTEFDAYLNLYANYTFDGTEEDYYGDTWYYYSSGDIFIDIVYYEYEGELVMELFAYTITEDDGTDDSGNGDSGNTGSGDNDGENNGENDGSGDTTKADEWLDEYDCISIDEAFDICDAAGETKSDRYYLIGTVVSIQDTFYGKMIIEDATGEILVYGSYGADGVNRYGELTVDVPKVGDVVLFYGNFMNYKGTREMYSGWIIDFYTPGETDSDNGGNSGNEGGNEGGNGSEGTTHEKTDFTSKEKDLMTQIIGFVIPFIPCDEYALEEYLESEDGYVWEGIYFYCFGNTEEEFEAYLNLLEKYTYDFSEEDEDGDTWYYFSNGEVYIDVVYYYYQGDYIVELYAYTTTEESGSGDSGNGDGGNTGSGDTTKADEWLDEYDCISIDEAFDICDAAGETKSDRYYLIGTVVSIQDTFYGKMIIEDATGEILVYGSYGADGVNRYGELTVDVPKVGDVVLFYGNFMNYKGTREMYSGWIIDFYTPGTSGSGNGTDPGVDIITNEGAGLPKDDDGVFEVDFTKAENVKDVTDLGYYIDGCPTTGSPAVLVIPVEFSDSLASSKGYTTAALVNAFSKNGKTDYYSVYDYYYISSYGQLTLDITVLDFWFKPKNNSKYYYNATSEIYGYEMAIGDQLVLDEALAYLSGIMDLSKFDSDNNGFIDAVVLVNTLDINEEDFYWAYRYWNFYTDEDDYYYEYDGVSAYDYVWASYQFLYECSDDLGNVYYDDGAMNTRTFIHEFAHILGADDYYDTEYVDHPMNGLDMMDELTGDHNAYTKINLGWITTSRLVVIEEGSITLSLKDFSKNGDTIIIANNWDEKLGAYQEYYVIMYYTGTGLNGGENGYFEVDGVVVYHINASLYREDFGTGEYSYYIYNTNTDVSSEYGTEDNLIEFVKSSNDTYVYLEGYTLPSVTDDLGEKLGYTFTVISIDGDEVVITFTAL